MGFSSFPDPAQYPSGNTPIYLGYAEITANSASFTTIAPISGLSVTVNVPANRRIRVTASAAIATTIGSPNYGTLYIYEGTGELAKWSVDTPLAQAEGCFASVILTPSAGFHTYFVQAALDTGTGVIGANAQEKAYILVEDITGVAIPTPAASVPVGVLAFSQTATDQAGITTATDLQAMSANVVVPAGRTLRISVQGDVFSSVAGDVYVLYIYEDGTIVQRVTDKLQAISVSQSLSCAVVRSPSAGSHTYKATLSRASGTGSLTFTSGNLSQYFLVEDITPTPTLAGSVPSSTLAYAEITASQSGISTDTDVAGLSVTVTVPAGRRLRISGEALCSNTVNNSGAFLRLKEDGTRVAESDGYGPVAGNTFINHVEAYRSPSAGTHTYKLSAGPITSGNATVFGASDVPAKIVVEDITQTSVYPVPTTNGVSIVSSTTRPGTSVEGLTIYETDSDLLRSWDGTNWKVTDHFRLTGVNAAINGSIPSTANLPYTGFKIQSGTFVASTDGSGDVTLTFPVPFPNGVITAMCCMGDVTVVQANPQVHVYSLTSFGTRVYNSTTGAAMLSTGPMRFNWIAIGW
jgi:hypothetical protein